jgi:hypothetical protein
MLLLFSVFPFFSFASFGMRETSVVVCYPFFIYLVCCASFTLYVGKWSERNFYVCALFLVLIGSYRLEEGEREKLKISSAFFFSHTDCHDATKLTNFLSSKLKNTVSLAGLQAFLFFLCV